MAVIPMKLAILDNIPLGIWIVVLPGPSNCVGHILHDSHTLDGLYIEVILRI